MVEKNPSRAVIEAGGVGYTVRITSETYAKLPMVGEACFVFLYLAVREDAMELFGFTSREERKLFLDLVKVKGVGPQHGLAILSSAPANEIFRAITAGDVKGLTRAKGVGTKLAQRIVLELKGELALEEEAGQAGASGPAADAEEALISLGYSRKEAVAAVRAALKEGEADTELLIRRALSKVK
ncbi:MAG: Holliday junction branch migration protein RuvA [Planctomycetes bacterium]|nr:Holliday junction branch migration protein RuvA [Planctomycetota bacterium]